MFHNELESEAIAEIRSALLQGQPLGSEKFKDAMSEAAGVRRTRTQRGRPVKGPDTDQKDKQPDFGF